MSDAIVETIFKIGVTVSTRWLSILTDYKRSLECALPMTKIGLSEYSLKLRNTQTQSSCKIFLSYIINSPSNTRVWIMRSVS